jgi:hypothetical protein
MNWILIKKCITFYIIDIEKVWDDKDLLLTVRSENIITGKILYN